MEPIFWKKLETNIKAQVLRRFQRVLRMISELRKLGYQGLKIYPYAGAAGKLAHPERGFDALPRGYKQPDFQLYQ